MEQYFVLDGILKRVVASPEGKEMILRFATEDDMDTSYAAWRLRTPAPYSIRASPRRAWPSCRCRNGSSSSTAIPDVKDDFEYEVMFLMSEVMAHTITLHLLDAPGRVHRFMRKHPELGRRAAEEGARVLPEPLARDALAPEAKRQDLIALSADPAWRIASVRGQP